MLNPLLEELKRFDVYVIDDGSKNQTFKTKLNQTVINTQHEGKRGFWKKWVLAQQIALGTKHDHFLFLPDDVSNVNLEALKEITRQEWDENFYAVNVINCGRTSCWGEFSVGQQPMQIGGVNLFEVGFVDCGFLTNRRTLECLEIEPPRSGWFDRPDKSSGVGYNMTQNMRMLGASMLMAEEGLVYHGDHPSQMHGKFREEVPLVSKK